MSTLRDVRRAGSSRRKLRRGEWVIWALLVLGGLVMVFPLYWMLVTAVTPGGQAQTNQFHLWPDEVAWSNLVDVWSAHPVGRWLLNSIFITVMTVAITVATSLLAGYAFAKYRFPGRDLLFVLVLVTIMVPIQVIMVPEFIIVSEFGLINSPWAVILPRAAEAIAVFMARQFMLDIPNDIIEAGRVDGASELGIFLRVVLPMSGPLVGVLVILTFVWHWNDFVWPLIALQGVNQFTLPIGLESMSSAYSAPWEAIMAVSLIATVPTILVFLVFQRKFVQGIASTGFK